jgi:predicted ATPase
MDVSQLLASGKGVKMLVTSRTPLRVRGEREYSVPPLTVPDPKRLPVPEKLKQYEAVRLFIERAQAARIDFQVTNQNAPAIAEICTRLDGLPLAIELAAARVQLFAPEALLTRLGARLATLTGGPRNMPARQQTLRAAIEWSYNLLSPSEQQLFRRLGVFHGRRTLEAVDDVCNYDAAFATSTLDWIQELLDKSLLRTEPAGSGEPRFVMLETIHEYARARLIESGELDEVRRRHGLYFLHLAEQVAPQLHQAQQYKVLAQLEEEFDNLRAVLEWALGDPNDDQFARLEVGLRLAAALTQFWDMHAHLSEGRRWFAALLDHYDRKVVDQGSVPSGGLKQARAGALCGAGWLAWRHADFTRAQTLSEESLAITTELGDQRGIAEALYNLACVALLQGQLASAYEFFQQSLVISPKLDDTFLMYVTLGNLAWVVEDRDGDAGAARRLREQSLALARVAGDKLTIARQLNNLGEAAQMAGDYGQARAMYEESLPIRQELGDKIGVAMVLNNLGLLAQVQTDFAAARPLHFRAFLLSEETGHQFFSGESLAYLAGALAREVMSTPPAGNAAISAPGTQTRGEKRRIAEGWRIGKLLGAAERLLEVTSQVFEPAKRQHYEQTLATVQELLGAEQFAAARREGRSLSVPELRAFAGELVLPLPGSQTDELFAS